LLLLQCSADAIAVEAGPGKVETTRSRAGPPPQILVLGALDDGEQGLYGWWGDSAVDALCSAQQRSAHRWVRAHRTLLVARVFIKVVHSSNAKMMSAPS
jgi:hypothetical protein